jgi:hypothetical protein
MFVEQVAVDTGNAVGIEGVEADVGKERYDRGTDVQESGLGLGQQFEAGLPFEGGVGGLDELVNLLIEQETIEGEEFQAVVERHGGSLNGVGPLPDASVAQPAGTP